MALTIPAGYGIASWGFATAGDPERMYCTMGIHPVSGPFDSTHLNRMETAWRIATGPLTRQVTPYALVELTARMTADGGGTSVFSKAANSPGGMADTAMAPNCAVIIEKRTALGGRRGTGRMFVPGVPQGDDDSDGRLASSRITGWNTAFAAFLTALLAAPSGSGAAAEKPLTPYLFHGNTTTTTRTRSGGTTTVTTVEGAAGPAPTEITGFQVDPVIGTQRRRLR